MFWCELVGLSLPRIVSCSTRSCYVDRKDCGDLVTFDPPLNFFFSFSCVSSFTAFHFHMKWAGHRYTSLPGPRLICIRVSAPSTTFNCPIDRWWGRLLRTHLLSRFFPTFLFSPFCWGLSLNHFTACKSIGGNALASNSSVHWKDKRPSVLLTLTLLISWERREKEEKKRILFPKGGSSLRCLRNRTRQGGRERERKKAPSHKKWKLGK